MAIMWISIAILGLSLLVPIVYVQYMQENITSTYRFGSGLMFDQIAGFYDMTNRLMSLGLDQGWREHLVNKLDLQEGDSCLDMSTGTGDVALLMGRQGKCQKALHGVDPSANMLAHARRKLDDAGFVEPRAVLIQAEAEVLVDFMIEGTPLYTKVACAFGIRNVEDRHVALASMNAAMDESSSATIAILEFLRPQQGWLTGPASLFLKFVLPVIGTTSTILAGKDSRVAASFDYLQRSIFEFPSESEFLVELESAGFVNCSSENVFGHIVTLFTCSTVRQRQRR